MDPASGRPSLLRREVLAWALYDWANSAFATTVMAGFFPVFFRNYWSAGGEPATATYRLGVANGVASLVIALSAPALGAVADRFGARKYFLAAFTVTGVVMTGSLYFVARGDWLVAAAAYTAASLGFAGANVFYDALIMQVAADEEMDRVSAFGFALGYLGGGLLFAVNVLMTLKPQWFGLADAVAAVRWSLASVALWWAVFSLPLLILVPEGGRRRLSLRRAVAGGVGELASVFHELRQLRPVWTFLLAYFLYIDGVNTVVKMAVDYGMALQFQFQHLLAALLLTQFVAFPAAMGFGWLGSRYGARRGILLALAVYVLVTVGAGLMQRVSEFYLLAVMVGLVQGGVQSLSRSLYAFMVPVEKSGEYFGFYNMLGKFAAVLGPFLVAAVALLSGNPRLSIVSIVVLFIAGAYLLLRVDSRAGRDATGVQRSTRAT